MAKQFKKYLDQDREITENLLVDLISFVKDNGGFIDMRNKNREGDSCYILIYDEIDERYKEFFLNAVAVFNDSLCVLYTENALCQFTLDKDELLENENWISVDSGYCWVNASLISIAEVIE